MGYIMELKIFSERKDYTSSCVNGLRIVCHILWSFVYQDTGRLGATTCKHGDEGHACTLGLQPSILYPGFEQFYGISQNFCAPDSNELWLVTSFSRPCQARMKIQRQSCVGTAAVWSSVILKRHDDHISCHSWWSGCGLDQWPCSMLFQVIQVTFVFFAYFFILKLDRATGMVSLCSACEHLSINIHLDFLRSPFDLQGKWPKVKIWPWHLGIKHMFRCVSTGKKAFELLF